MLQMTYLYTFKKTYSGTLSVTKILNKLSQESIHFSCLEYSSIILCTFYKKTVNFGTITTFYFYFRLKITTFTEKCT